ncbi:MAG: PEPxxWA-CTERM sorting domain-containing protein [Altererythrobacter sp.]|nr:PEPxxWA-CTERM sorting domain-containing protein [Altererythrobacter sp.]
MKSASLAASAALLACALPAAAQQSETLEVVSGPLGSRAQAISWAGPIGQSFTAFTDTLSSVGFQFSTFNSGSANSAITLALYSGETLTGTALYSSTFTLPLDIARASWFDIALPDIAVTDGNLYTFALSTSSLRTGVHLGPDIRYGVPGFPTGQIVGGDAYAGGQMLAARATYPNCTVASGNNCDLNFRITGQTFAAAVPEPGSWALMILGFGITGSALRASRKRRVALNYV